MWESKEEKDLMNLWPGDGIFNPGSFPLVGAQRSPSLSAEQTPAKAEWVPNSVMEADPGWLLKTYLLCTIASSPSLLKKFPREELQSGESRNLWSEKNVKDFPGRPVVQNLPPILFLFRFMKEIMPHHSYLVREGRNNFIPFLLYCGYSSLTLNPNLTEGSFSKGCCKVESETMWMKFCVLLL